MTNKQAWVTPLQGWPEDGLANVLELKYPPDPVNQPVMTPLDNTDKQDQTVKKSEHPIGLVLIPNGNEPGELPSVLPLINVLENQKEVQIGSGTDNPNGVVVLFKSS
ncbi:MAG: hypothetical protein KAW09_06300 [Thermoplasmata archaeon]|nr:hypothetical protein [Thermoplasmata archaeon]